MDVLLVRLETKTATVAGMDAQLARLDTNTATGFRHLRWGLEHRDRAGARLGDESDP